MLTLLCLLQSLPPGSVDRDVCRTAVLELHSSSYSIVKPVKSPPTYPRLSTPSSSLSFSCFLSLSLSLSRSLSLPRATPVHVCLLSHSELGFFFSKNCSAVFEDPLCFLLLGGAAVMRDHREKGKKEKKNLLYVEKTQWIGLSSLKEAMIYPPSMCVTRCCSASPYLTAQI